jgi:hypothetical protein
MLRRVQETSLNGYVPFSKIASGVRALRISELSVLIDLNFSGDNEHYRASYWWITFFAPSSSSYALPHLSEHFSFSTSSPAPEQPQSSLSKKRPAHIASIGPTTTVHLTQTLNLKVDITAAKPTPEALLVGIRRHDTDQRRQTVVEIVEEI